MDVYIKEWPQSRDLIDLLPIMISCLAVILSAISLFLSKGQFKLSQRPYVSAANFLVLCENGATEDTSNLMCKCMNQPARIINLSGFLKVNDKNVISIIEEDFVRFPDGGQWSFSLGGSKLNSILSSSDTKKDIVERELIIKYSALTGGKTYSYSLRQTYDFNARIWCTTKEV